MKSVSCGVIRATEMSMFFSAPRCDRVLDREIDARAGRRERSCVGAAGGALPAAAAPAARAWDQLPDVRASGALAPVAAAGTRQRGRQTRLSQNVRSYSRKPPEIACTNEREWSCVSERPEVRSRLTPSASPRASRSPPAWRAAPASARGAYGTASPSASCRRFARACSAGPTCWATAATSAVLSLMVCDSVASSLSSLSLAASSSAASPGKSHRCPSTAGPRCPVRALLSPCQNFHGRCSSLAAARHGPRRGRAPVAAWFRLIRLRPSCPHSVVADAGAPQRAPPREPKPGALP